jgi:hypothetical protein
MDHNNLASQGHPHGQCPHGRCLDHGPEWENVGEARQEPNPGFFGLMKTFWMDRCCGKPMSRYKVVQTRRCKKCGRTEDNVTHRYLALCLCCSYHFDNTPATY